MGTMLTHETIQGIEALANGLSRMQPFGDSDGTKVIMTLATRDTIVHALRQLCETHAPPPPAIDGIHDMPFRLQVLGALCNKLHSLAAVQRAQGNSLSAETMENAAGAILELCQIPKMSDAERFYRENIERTKREIDPHDTEPADLPVAIAFAKRWIGDACPPNALGQVHFARALCESLIDAAEKHLRIEEAGRKVLGAGLKPSGGGGL